MGGGGGVHLPPCGVGSGVFGYSDSLSHPVTRGVCLYEGRGGSWVPHPTSEILLDPLPFLSDGVCGGLTLDICCLTALGIPIIGGMHIVVARAPNFVHCN